MIPLFLQVGLQQGCFALYCTMQNRSLTVNAAHISQRGLQIPEGLHDRGCICVTLTHLKPGAARARRWEALRPRGGPGGNPAIILAQLEGMWAQLQEMKDAAAKHAQVGDTRYLILSTHLIFRYASGPDGHGPF
jgi:hypothetical protein